MRSVSSAIGERHRRQKVVDTLRRADRSQAFAMILGVGTVERESQRIMDASQQSIATSMGSSPRFLQAIEDRLPSALLLPGGPSVGARHRALRHISKIQSPISKSP